MAGLRYQLPVITLILNLEAKKSCCIGPGLCGTSENG
jgi:hypothetical protein